MNSTQALPTMALMVLCGKRYTLANVAAARGPDPYDASVVGLTGFGPNVNLARVPGGGGSPRRRG